MSNRTYDSTIEDDLQDILSLIETAQHHGDFEVHLPQAVIDDLALQHQHQYQY